MEFASGASGHIEASRVATGRTWHQSLEVIGSKGALQFVQQDIHTLRLYLTGDPVERRATARSRSARPTATTASSGRSPGFRSACTS